MTPLAPPSDSRITLTADWVIPVSSPPIRDGWIQVQGNQITAIGPAKVAKPDTLGIIDLGNVILTPGLVNPHTHLELTCYAGMLEPADFWTWIARLVQIRFTPGMRERESAAVTDGAWQLLRNGVTCVGDISRLNLHWRPLKSIPIRKICFVELLSVADNPPRNADELRCAVAEVEEDDLLTLGITPHAPYTVPTDHLTAAIRLADELDRPWTAHWAETREEVAFLSGDQAALPLFLRGLCQRIGLRSPCSRPVDYLLRCAAGMHPGSIAHGNYIEPDEADALAAAGHIVVYCPRAHAFFGHQRHPIATLRRAGVTVAVGTDSAASNYGLSILDELRFLKQIRPEFSPAELFEMGTLSGARALRLDGKLGSLEPGKQADLAAFSIASSSRSDPLLDLLTSDYAVKGVWVAGQRVI